MALDDLIRARTREQVVQRMLTVLAAGRGGVNPQNFPLTNYIPGDPLRTLLELSGEGIADVERTVAALGAGGYLATAEGAWLAALTESHYGIGRQPSTFARGIIQFTAAPGAAVALPPGLIVGTAGGQRYVTTEAAIAQPGTPASVGIQAESPGTAYNVPIGTISILHTPLPGLSVTNPPGWLTQAGADAESDAALARRARLRWAELGGGATRAAYEYWALTAHPSVDRVRILDEHPRGQGTVDVVIWGTGGLGAAVVAAVDAYIQARRPVSADVQVYSAEEVLAPVALQLYAPFGDRSTIEAQILTGLAGLQRESEIGGTVYRAQVIEAAMLPAGMLDVTTLYRDVVLAPTQAITFLPTLTWRATP